MKKILLFALISSSICMAQQLPELNHYYLHPFFYNPSFIGIDGATQFSLLHRRQWWGVNGSPVTTALNAEIPTASPLSIGVNLYNDTYGIVSNTRGLVGASYVVNFNDVSYLRAGLSFGVGSQSLDMKELGDKDMTAVGNYSGNTVYLDGNAGFAFGYQNLRIGIALPVIFDRKVMTNESFSRVEFGAFKYLLFSARYKFSFGDNFELEPQLLYRFSQGGTNQIEAIATLYMFDRFWFGTSVRQNYGTTFFVGAKFNDSQKIGYMYGIPPEGSNIAFPIGTHEVMLTIAIGGRKKSTIPSFSNRKKNISHDDYHDKMKENERKHKERLKAAQSNKRNSVQNRRTIANVDQETTTDQVQKQKPVETNPNDKPTTFDFAAVDKKEKSKIAKLVAVRGLNKKINLDTIPPTVFPSAEYEQTKELVTAVKSTSVEEIKKGHYVTVGTFQIRENAEKYVKEIQSMGLKANFKFNSKKGYFYVHVNEPKTLDEAKGAWSILRLKEGFKDTWILTVEE